MHCCDSASTPTCRAGEEPAFLLLNRAIGPLAERLWPQLRGAGCGLGDNSETTDQPHLALELFEVVTHTFLWWFRVQELARDHVELLKGQYFWCQGQERWEVTSCFSASMATAEQGRQLGDDQGVSPSLLGVRLQGEECVRGKHRRHGAMPHGSDVVLHWLLVCSATDVASWDLFMRQMSTAQGGAVLSCSHGVQSMKHHPNTVQMSTAQGGAVLSCSWSPAVQPSLSQCEVAALSLPLCCDPLNGTFVIRKAFASSQGATDRATCENCHPSWWSNRTAARKLSQRRRHRWLDDPWERFRTKAQSESWTDHDGEDRRVESAKDRGVSFLKTRGAVHTRPSCET